MKRLRSKTDYMNKVFIATSIDGYIADDKGGIDWLHSVPNPTGDDMGYSEFMSTIDALVMGRNTFEVVLGFDIDWPYDKPVFVLSDRLKEVPGELAGKVEIVNGELKTVLEAIHKKGYLNLYIDGGKTIQNFLKEDLIDEMTLTTIPVLLGGGIKLFGEHQNSLEFECVSTKRFLNKVGQSTFIRKRQMI